MRKLILIALALMTTTPCYAHLTLAAADVSPTLIEETKTTPSAVAQPMALAKSVRILRPRQHHQTKPVLRYRTSHGGC